MSERPKLSHDVEINPVADGYIVYQPEKDRVHYLNHSAAVVLELCTGDHDYKQISDTLKIAYDLEEAPEKFVSECLDKFATEGLVS